ncbi:MAG: hypothetical protein AVO35_03050 [Candidatus Aegiribacteria sp. MLS_C]|nr:MAG: hypothetical protein AVO35_03050 [Candidatus Aegiribacteria sp. MLS_C]
MAVFPGGFPRVLILDYSVDRSEGPLFSKYVPSGSEAIVSSVFSGDGIPSASSFSHVMHTGSSLSICVDADFVPEAAGIVEECVGLGIPQVGVCYGHQLLCRALLGPEAVGRCPEGIEAGWMDVDMMGSGLKIPGASGRVRVLQSHFDRVEAVPAGAEIVASNGHTRIQAFVDGSRRLMGFQFHPEFDREDGNNMFRRDRELLEVNGIDVDEVLAGGPSIDTGAVFFGYFFGGRWFHR